MFFWLSKIFWFLAHPVNLVFMGVCLVAVLLAVRWMRAARIVAFALALACLTVAVLPIGGYIRGHLESRFPVNPELPEKIDGIVVLGGVINAELSGVYGTPQVGSGVERVAEVRKLLAHSPAARIIFTGGSGDPLRPEMKEAHHAPDVFRWFGIDPARVVFEDQARNTAENAQITHRIAKPKPDEAWVLVTSAFHMPRSVGAFRKVGWRIIPYPVDFSTLSRGEFRLSINFASQVYSFSAALHESLGLLFYWLTGRTTALFPAPEQ